MESAIPTHLRCPRSLDTAHPPEYAPPNPAYTARFASTQQQMTVAFVGAQYRCPKGEALARAAVRRWAETQAHAPDNQDVAVGIDEAGYHTVLWTGYWADPGRFDLWRHATEFKRWWDSDERLNEPCGWFMETAHPKADRLETLYSSADGFEGAGWLAERMSGEIREHGYWGSMRDRLPASQHDELIGSSDPIPQHPTPQARVAFSGADNIALIRSGQDWSATQGRERDLYLREVEPVLRQGMAFLDSPPGLDAGCLASRYLNVVDESFQPVQKSYGLSWWASLNRMEHWAKSHPTHTSIFGTFMRMVQALDFKLALRLSHEVSVLRSREQRFEYINCHARTGLLRTESASQPVI